MEYTEEEKKAIEDLDKINFLLDDVYSTNLLNNEERNEYQKSIDIVLNLIEKQQKEIERLYKDNYRLGRENQLKFERAVDTSDYVSKEAIREKIKEIETKSYYKNGYYDTGAKMILKELLGE